MSFNNYADTEAAWRLAADLAAPGVVIMKHMNACGAAEASTLADAFGAAWECDPVSAFGGIVAVNVEVDESTADSIARNFVEVVIAPALTEGAADVFAAKKNLRVVTARFPDIGDLDMRRVEGGMLVQRRDVVATSGGAMPADWRVVSERPPTDDETAALRLAWTVAAHTKSNAVGIANGLAAGGGGARGVAGRQPATAASRRAMWARRLARVLCASAVAGSSSRALSQWVAASSSLPSRLSTIARLLWALAWPGRRASARR